MSGWGILEVAKFAVYIAVPGGLMHFFAKNPQNLHKIMGGSKYCAYPPPHSPEELREMARDFAPKRHAR